MKQLATAIFIFGNKSEGDLKLPRGWKRLACYFLVGCALTLLSCDSQAPEKKFLIGFSQCTTGDAWRQTMLEDMKRELAFHPDLELVIEDAGNSNEQQIEQIRALAARGIDLLIISPNEAEPMTQAVEEVFSKGIPVVLLDRKTSSDLYTAYIGGDNRSIGETAATYAANRCGGKCKVLEIWGLRGSTPAMQRHEGFVEALKKFPDMEIVGEVDGRWEAEFVARELPTALRQHPEVNLIFAHNDRMALAAWQVAQKFDREKQLHFIGVDGLPGATGGIQLVEDGILDATLLYPTGGEQAIRIASDILHYRSFQKENILLTTVIDQRNGHIFQGQSNKILEQKSAIERQQKRIDQQKRLFESQQIALYCLLVILLAALGLGLWMYWFWQKKRQSIRQLELENQDLVAQKNHLLEQAKKAAAATQAKVNFFISISHELRTPLTLILGYVEGLLATGNLSHKDAKQDLGMVRKNALRLLRLANQLTDVRKIEEGQLPLRATENDLVAFVRDIADVFKKAAVKKNIEFRFFSRETHLPAWFDPHLLDKAMLNLLTNAFEHTQNDGTGKVDVVIIKDLIANQAVIKVEDNGKGMTKEQAEVAFEKNQANGSNFTAVGLGLFLTKELVSLHGGSMALWSEKNKGSRLEITLPLGKEHLQPEQTFEGTAAQVSPAEAAIFEEETTLLQLSPASATGAPTQETPQTLLLVEQDDEVRQFLKKHFGKTYHLLEATDGNVALQLAFEEQPVLILAGLAEMSKGLALTKTLKADLRTSHIPVVLLANQSAIEQKIEGIQTGADAFVTKPFNLVFLSEIVKNLLRGRENLRERYASPLPPGKLRSAVGNLDQQFLSQFTRYVEANFADQNLTVQHIGDEFNLSRAQLFRKVKALLGLSVNDYIQQVRMKRACQLLLEGKMTVSEIAYRVGYSSPAYFATAFKTVHYCSPSEFKEKNSRIPSN